MMKDLMMNGFFINLINVLRILIFLYIGIYIVLFMEKSIGVFIEEINFGKVGFYYLRVFE